MRSLTPGRRWPSSAMVPLTSRTTRASSIAPRPGMSTESIEGTAILQSRLLGAGGDGSFAALRMTSEALMMADGITTGVKRRQLGLMALVMVMFFTVSGGPYGLEELVSQSGPGIALVLLLVTP